MVPTVSMVEDRGITPAVEMASFVGLKPTIEWIAAGAMMEPVVSVPIAAAEKLAAAAAPLPKLDPSGERLRGSKGLWVWPALEL